MYKAQDVEDGLIFIVGCGRSGTTLVKSILNAHPIVYISPETFFFSSIIKKGEKLFSRDEKINYLLSHWWIEDMLITKNAIEECMEKESDEWQDIFLALLGSLAKEKEIKIFGEKTPQHIREASNLLETYKHCRILHIVRDPRAVYSSYLNVPVGTSQVASVISEWTAAMNIHATLKDESRYFSLKYEDLVANPSIEMNKVCKFLDINYAPEMLSFFKRDKAGYAPEQVHHKNTLSPVFNSSTYSWRDKLSPAEIGMLEAYLGKQISMMGYDLMGETVSIKKLRYVYSELCDRIAKIFIRRPRQLLKKLKAKSRMKVRLK